MSARRLGDYELLRRLAVGGMAEVYLARLLPRGDGPTGAVGERHERHDVVVLKVLLPQHAADPAFVAMFADEAELAARLDHRALVRVLASGCVGDEHYLVMEHVDGVTLAALLDETRRTATPLEPALALAIAARLLEGLRYLHGSSDESGRSLDVVHRDVTPGNVLLSRRGEVKLADFGIARHRLRQARTRTGVIKGTVQYMAPEQIAEDRVDRRADLYGVGLVLFELLTGRPFLEAEREVELLALAAEPVWRAPSSLRADLDARLDQLLRPALQRFAEQRYRDADAFLAALERTREELGFASDDDETTARLAARVEALATAAGPREVAATREPGESEGERTRNTERRTATATPLATPPATPPATPAATAPATPPATVAARGGLGWLLLAVLAAGGAASAYLLARDGGTHEARPSDGAPRASDGARRRPTAPDLAPDLTRDHARAPGVAGDAGAAAPPAQDSRVTSPDLHRRRRRRPRRPRRDARVRASSPKLDAGRPVTPRPKPKDLAAPALGQALRALRSRGIRRDDLAIPIARELAGVEQALARGEVGLLPRVQTLVTKLAALRVDAALVKTKLARVHARLRRLPAARRKPLDERASLALQDYMDGRHGAANAHLEAILSSLAQ